ncbi:zinc ribbon-containing protein [Alkalilimnicola ehrlichii MLHE-1]|uniref:Zinc ribbon-containing protein n=1 Tax=Alkalilimnicola ehrlichii (strain ATCC BAA-1101 / DSM 17681 / MLHE-1) TaxID=187272 RepID=Q0ABN4_ALKEH|nr:zinc ribbon-containing protein [Alkalilimnicola ehrlichii]ABI55753.1 protein of unknown function DUF1451 [Alkalilimnicola ehrlichii MLHE-1]
MNDEQKKEEQQHLLRGYDRMLDRIRERIKGDRHSVADALQWAKEQAVELGELTRDEAENIAEYLRRDVEEAGRFLAHTDERDLRGWFQMDLQLLENWLWDAFSSVADRTRVEWLEFQRTGHVREEYRTGEITGPGVLECQECGRNMTFSQTGHVPPCPACHGTRFVRRTGWDQEEQEEEKNAN